VNQLEAGTARQAPEGSQSFRERLQYEIYVVALVASICMWFLAIRAPLWLDETSSFWQISAGFWQIFSRRG